MVESAARTLIEGSLVWDNHGCMPLRPDDDTFLPQLARYKAAGMTAVSLNVGFGEQGVEDHIRMIAHFRRWLSQHQSDYLMASTVDDIELARRTGKLAVLFDIEGMNAVADQPSLVQLYYDLGVRWMLIAYNRTNRAGGGCQDQDPGLTSFGRQVLDEMARVGMIACCSHTGYRTSRDVMTYSSRPVIFSHSNALAVHDHPRNVPDDALRACAATGGVVGVNGIGLFLASEGDLTESLVRHIDYLAELIGVEHVGLGLDYVFDRSELENLTAADPEGFPGELGYGREFRMVPPEALEQIVTRLNGLGYDDGQVRAILGENLMRVARAVWRPPFSDPSILG